MHTRPPLAETESPPLLDNSRQPHLDWLWDLLLIAILLVGGYFRFIGLNWDQNQHLHPDERFLTMVETSIQPVTSFSQYFDTQASTLNPNNRGFGFYVYGTLPLIAVRYVAEWLGQTGYDEVQLVGRQLSALMDLGTVCMVYLIFVRLYRNRGFALLAAAFASASVLPIQLSHYFAVDTFTNFFGMLTFYFAACLLPEKNGWRKTQNAPESHDEAANPSPFSGIGQEWGSIIVYILFGVALGLAMASKINALMLAALLPGAVLLRYLSQPIEERERWFMIYARNLLIAALAAFFVFRIFQPYAFIGPGFLGVKPNPQWIDSLRGLAAQSTGDVDFPPALQWARRPIWFALQNMVLWGLGLPLGLLAWAGFFWMGYEIFKGSWRQHLMLWGWTGGYFAYQSFNWTRAMRYQMLVYPTLAIIAAWIVMRLWQPGEDPAKVRVKWWRAASLFTGLLTLSLTVVWAYAFTRIYTRPVTRVEASRWIYQNVPGPLNLPIHTIDGVTNQPVAYRSGYTLQSDGSPLVIAFRPHEAGELIDLRFEHLVSPASDQVFKTLSISLSDNPDKNSFAVAQLADEFLADGDPRGKNYSINFTQGIELDPAQTYYFIIALKGNGHSLDLSGPVTFSISTGQNFLLQSLPEPVDGLRIGNKYEIGITAVETGDLPEIVLDHVVDWEGREDVKTLRVALVDIESGNELAASQIRSSFNPGKDTRGEGYTVRFDTPAHVELGHRYTIQVEHVDGAGTLAVYGSKQANESSWDDALPLGLDGYNPYDYRYGVYRSDLNFEMYWDDNRDKLNRFVSTLDQADYIFISSNRQWGTTTRVPERYPLTSEYYRRLLGCPAEKEITWCYSVAQPGMFTGNLGFELAAVFQSDPNLGDLRFNTQFAEEAFTVYDHPKVLIFKKDSTYALGKVQAILGAVDLSTVVHVTPRKATSYPGNLMLPTERLAQQRAGGTWADLFDTSALINRYPVLGVIAWYLAITLLGWTVYPFTRLALRGLPDLGYPLVRLVGMLLLAYPVWLLGSNRVPFEPLTISAVFILLLAVNAFLAARQWNSLRAEIQKRWKYYLAVEALALAFFVLFLLVRLGNSDLWHPWKGGEKPMDFSYFNAVLKSTTFPPYDPWFAGGYINYYYYGFVLVGVPVKWLGIVPSVAYNLILPTLFSLLAMGAFSVGWNLYSSTRRESSRNLSTNEGMRSRDFVPQFSGFTLDLPAAPWLAGLSAAIAVVILGNWGTVRMIWRGVQRLANMQVEFDKAPLFLHFAWTFEGLWRLLTVPGLRLPYAPGDWYWIPSRAIPGEPITEFPAFTFLYADLHAHMIALPITILALSWGISIVLNRWSWKDWGEFGASIFLSSLAIGSLRPTNTWDWPTYLLLGCAALVYTVLRGNAASPLRLPWIDKAPLAYQTWLRRAVFLLLSIGALVGLSMLLYHPYTRWYGQGYNQIEPWQGAHTPFWSYLTHWGVFLFVIASWMVWETVDWMANTPVSRLNVLRRHRELIIAAVISLFGVILTLLIIGIEIAWLVVLLAAWAGLLLLRSGLPDAKRIVLFMVGTSLVLTLFVEVAVLQGDIGRMNTVFKFYLQAWTLLALSAGAALFWLLPAVARMGNTRLRTAWSIALILLVAGAAMFPLLAGMDKITDRMAVNAPHSLDGMLYMAYSTYSEESVEMDLSEDYRAIHWMQENVSGSPVIVEANVPEYQWGNRFTIYTGLPGVVGWNWHQRQQRALTPGEWIFSRVDAIKQFYNTIKPDEAVAFLQRYQVQYIVVGQLERAVYSPSGLAKFTVLDGTYWQLVYSDGETAVYKVNQ